MAFRAGHAIIGPMDIENLEHILRVLKQNDVTEFELESNGTHIRLARGAMLAHTAAAAVASSNKQSDPVVILSSTNGTHPVSEGAETLSDKLVKVESPIVGTFYRRPSPDSEPFIQEGSVVKKGDTLCIIEAMKLMNEIEAPASGKIEKILLQDGQVVEFGETIVLINPGI